MWPSFTGGMVTKFQSAEAEQMLTWLRDDVWPYVNPQYINYAFMQEPLLAGEVWVAFDHTARLLTAFNEKPDDFVAFPAPSGPAGLGFMPVIAGFGIPKTAPHPEAAMEAINYLTTPEVQGRVLRELGFFGSERRRYDRPAASMPSSWRRSPRNRILTSTARVAAGGLGARGEINQIFRNVCPDRMIEDVVRCLPKAANLRSCWTTGAPWARRTLRRTVPGGAR
jgi:multiple sugar transport system substrate-binding protein